MAAAAAPQHQVAAALIARALLPATAAAGAVEHQVLYITRATSTAVAGSTGAHNVSNST
jgi:hypothetical protein